MIDKDRLISFGYVSRPHGYKGDVHITLERKIVPLKRDDFVFIQLQGQFIPYKITLVKGKTDAPVVNLEFIDTYEKAQNIVGCPVFTDQDVLPEDSELSFVGFELIDAKKGSIGKVLDVQELPQQLMLTVSHQGEEKYIPLVEDFIDHISQENQEIWLHLPEGLLDL
jgi:16S rRNA processing protein RimM